MSICNWLHRTRAAQLFVTIAAGSLAMAQSNIAYTDLKDQGAAFITPQSDVFARELERQISRTAQQAIQPLLPYSVLIRNLTNNPWMAVCVTWELKNPKGQPIVHSMTIQTLVNDQNRMVQPQEYLLMAPKSGISRRLRNGGQADSAVRTLSWPDEGLFRAQETIRVSLDAVVLANGQLLGPDQQGTAAKLNAWMAADKDLVAAFKSLRGNDIRAAAATLAAASESTGPWGFERHYQEHRKRRARSLLAVLDNQGEEAFFRTLNAMESMDRIPTVHRQ